MTGLAMRPFSPEALDANRSGHLSPAQRQAVGRAEIRWQRVLMAGAILSAILGIAAVVAAILGSTSEQAGRLVEAAVLLALAAILSYRSLGGDPVARDLRDGRVETVEGALKKRIVHYGRDSNPNYYLDVADRSFRVPLATWSEVPDTRLVRLYYLPRSKRLVNFERLHEDQETLSTPDSTPQTTDSPTAGVPSHDKL